MQQVEAAPTSGLGRRALFLGVLVQPVLFGLLKGETPLLTSSESRSKVLESIDSYYDGDAVSSPLLEIQLLELLENEDKTPTREAKLRGLVTALETRGGTQIAAANGQGRWVLPWVGGWDRLWTSATDSSYLGGPASNKMTRRGIGLEQISARNYVYGPGESGITVEYLHSADGDETAPLKFLLTRPGTVTNLGDNIFQLDFNTAMDEYEVLYDRKKDVDRLANCVETLNADGSPSGLLDCKKLDGGAERGAPVSTLLVRTTYLSERLWIVRDARNNDSVAVFQRTATRSVMDRRGLVADGQLKPPDDEQVRYGKLLFGETLQEYAGWDENQVKLKQEKDKLLGGR